MTFAQRLKVIRKSRKITQDEIAAVLAVKRQTYSAYERGVSTPDSHTLKKLADYFDVSTDSFFAADETKARDNAQNDQEQKLLLLARRAEKIPSDQRERLIKNFEDNIDLYLEAMGYKGNAGNK